MLKRFPSSTRIRFQSATPKNSLAKAGLVADLYAFMVETTGAENLSAEGWGVVAPPAMKRRGIFGFVGFDLVMQGRGGVGQ